MARKAAKPMTKVWRLRQLFRWLKVKYPTPYPVVLQLTPKRLMVRDEPGEKLDECYGLTRVQKKRILIVITTRKPKNVCEETLLHEYAHAMEVRHFRLDASHWRDTRGWHDDHFWITYGRLYRDFYEGGGLEESEKA